MIFSSAAGEVKHHRNSYVFQHIETAGRKLDPTEVHGRRAVISSIFRRLFSGRSCRTACRLFPFAISDSSDDPEDVACCSVSSAAFIGSSSERGGTDTVLKGPRAFLIVSGGFRVRKVVFALGFVGALHLRASAVGAKVLARRTTLVRS